MGRELDIQVARELNDTSKPPTLHDPDYIWERLRLPDTGKGDCDVPYL